MQKIDAEIRAALAYTTGEVWGDYLKKEIFEVTERILSKYVSPKAAKRFYVKVTCDATGMIDVRVLDHKERIN